MALPKKETEQSLKDRIHEIIFEADTKAGKLFDVVLIIAIFLSILVVLLESVKEYQDNYATAFFVVEWIFTVLFTIEYCLRIYAIRRPIKYIFSFFGLVDVLSILPAFISLIIPGSQSLLVIRILRLLRIFRIFKLGHFLKEAALIIRVMEASRTRIVVFLFFILLLVTIIGALMYLVEGSSNPGFSSIPRSIYWSIVTVTTVGFGDITPQTPLGQFLSGVIMIMGYAIIAVPTGIVSAEMFAEAHQNKKITTQACRDCGKEGHDHDAKYCKYCSAKLNAD